MFSLEQSLQLFLKTCLLRYGVEYPRTHSVRRLIELLSSVTGSEDVGSLLERFSIELGALEDAYISSRYVPRTYTRSEAERLLKVVKEVMRVVREATGCGGEET